MRARQSTAKNVRRKTNRETPQHCSRGVVVAMT
jgi:hypothetical protein